MDSKRALSINCWSPYNTWNHLLASQLLLNNSAFIRSFTRLYAWPILLNITWDALNFIVPVIYLAISSFTTRLGIHLWEKNLESIKFLINKERIVDILQNQVTPLPTRNGSWDSRAASLRLRSHLAASTLKNIRIRILCENTTRQSKDDQSFSRQTQSPDEKRGRGWTREDQSGREKKIRQFTSKWLRSDPSRCGDRLHSICIRVAHSGLQLLLRLFSFSSVCAALGCVLCIAELLSSRQACWER